jgi:hypothetical protein
MPGITTNAAVFSFMVLVKLYDDATDNHWNLPGAWMQAMRVGMVLLYGIVIMLSVELHVLAGNAAVCMLIADRIISNANKKDNRKDGNAKKPCNLDDPFFQSFALLVLVFFCGFCALRPAVLYAHLSRPLFAVGAMAILAHIIDQVLTPEEYSATKAASRGVVMVLCSALLFLIKIRTDDGMWASTLQPITWGVMGYNATWFVTHYSDMNSKP